MNQASQPRRGTNVLLILAALVIVAAGLRAAAPVVALLLLSLFLAMLASPPIAWLQERKVPSGLAILLVATTMSLTLLLLAILLGNSIAEFAGARAEHQARIQQVMTDAVGWGASQGIDLRGYDIHRALDASAAMGFFGSVLGEIGSALGNLFLILFMVIFILFEASSIPAKLHAMTSDPDRFLAYLADVRAQVNEYFGVLTLVSLATGALVTLLLLAIGVEFALLWGLLAFLLNYVPNIGSILAAVPAVLLALAQLGPGAAGLTAAGYLVVNMVIGNVIQPRLMGRGLGLSTLTVFVSLVVWGWLLGPIGMLVSVPLTGALKLALENHASTRPIAIVLGTVDDARQSTAGS
jgi:predicted PurR-regulated permease PerM